MNAHINLTPSNHDNIDAVREGVLRKAYIDAGFKGRPSWEIFRENLPQRVDRALAVMLGAQSLAVTREREERIWVVGNYPLDFVPGTVGKTYKEAESILNAQGLDFITLAELLTTTSSFELNSRFSNDVTSGSTWVKSHTRDIVHSANWDQQDGKWILRQSQSDYIKPNRGAVGVLRIPLPRA